MLLSIRPSPVGCRLLERVLERVLYRVLYIQSDMWEEKIMIREFWSFESWCCKCRELSVV